MSHSEQTGIERLRNAVRAFDNCNESFLQQWGTDDLLKIHEAWCKSEWDVFPDQWTERQITMATCTRTPPQFRESEKTGLEPIYPSDSDWKHAR